MRRLVYELIESLRIAFAQIYANKLRSVLTALGVIIGIVAVTLMGTAINGIDAGVDRSLAGFGDDIVYVSKFSWRERGDWTKIRNRRPMRAEYTGQINEWIESTPGSALKVAVPYAQWFFNVSRGENRLRNIMTFGTSADYARIVRSDVKDGRFFSEFESHAAANVVVIGYDVANALFPSESPIGQSVRVRDQNFRVVGVVGRQGSFFGAFSWDSMMVIPLGAFRRFTRSSRDSDIQVQVDVKRMPEAKDELTGLMRRIRQLSPEAADDFALNEVGTIRERIDPIKNGIALAGLFITGLALFVGAIGIMNITYVSVKERTKEIGTRKALGARRRTILLQFLIEAVSICFVGGVGGLALAAGLTQLVAVVAPSFPLVFSIGLVLTGLVVSVFTGIFSGFAPAWSASKLDPVEALRYE
ncbi:MAG: ABC transporter permease [Opitutus sp.]|nr:ABC transporter permease [Opitutus sp.]